MLRGGDRGPAIDETRPEQSLILEMISWKSDEYAMPPTGQLPEADLAILTEWVLEGGTWAEGVGADPSAASLEEMEIPSAATGGPGNRSNVRRSLKSPTNLGFAIRSTPSYCRGLKPLVYRPPRKPIRTYSSDASRWISQASPQHPKTSPPSSKMTHRTPTRRWLIDTSPRHNTV